MASDAWIVSSGRVLASATVVTSRRERRRGLLGRADFDGALVLPHCRWIHTIGMKFPIDVAYLDDGHRVVKITRVGRYRVCAPVGRAATVVEARHGAFERWGLRPGDVVEIRPVDDSGHR